MPVEGDVEDLGGDEEEDGDGDGDDEEGDEGMGKFFLFHLIFFTWSRSTFLVSYFQSQFHFSISFPRLGFSMFFIFLNLCQSHGSHPFPPFHNCQKKTH